MAVIERDGRLFSVGGKVQRRIVEGLVAAGWTEREAVAAIVEVVRGQAWSVSGRFMLDGQAAAAAAVESEIREAVQAGNLHLVEHRVDESRINAVGDSGWVMLCFDAVEQAASMAAEEERLGRIAQAELLNVMARMRWELEAQASVMAWDLAGWETGRREGADQDPFVDRMWLSADGSLDESVVLADRLAFVAEAVDWLDRDTGEGMRTLQRAFESRYRVPWVPAAKMGEFAREELAAARERFDAAWRSAAGDTPVGRLRRRVEDLFAEVQDAQNEIGREHGRSPEDVGRIAGLGSRVEGILRAGDEALDRWTREQARAGRGVPAEYARQVYRERGTVRAVLAADDEEPAALSARLGVPEYRVRHVREHRGRMEEILQAGGRALGAAGRVAGLSRDQARDLYIEGQSVQAVLASVRERTRGIADEAGVGEAEVWSLYGATDNLREIGWQEVRRRYHGTRSLRLTHLGTAPGKRGAPEIPSEVLEYDRTVLERLRSGNYGQGVGDEELRREAGRVLAGSASDEERDEVDRHVGWGFARFVMAHQPAREAVGEDWEAALEGLVAEWRRREGGPDLKRLLAARDALMLPEFERGPAWHAARARFCVQVAGVAADRAAAEIGPGQRAFVDDRDERRRWVEELGGGKADIAGFLRRGMAEAMDRVGREIGKDLERLERRAAGARSAGRIDEVLEGTIESVRRWRDVYGDVTAFARAETRAVAWNEAGVFVEDWKRPEVPRMARELGRQMDEQERRAERMRSSAPDVWDSDVPTVLVMGGEKAGCPIEQVMAAMEGARRRHGGHMRVLHLGRQWGPENSAVAWARANGVAEHAFVPKWEEGNNAIWKRDARLVAERPVEVLVFGAGDERVNRIGREFAAARDWQGELVRFGWRTGGDVIAEPDRPQVIKGPVVPLEIDTARVEEQASLHDGGMLELARQLVTQHESPANPGLRRALESPLIEIVCRWPDGPQAAVWGAGDGGGENRLGLALQVIRGMAMTDTPLTTEEVAARTTELARHMHEVEADGWLFLADLVGDVVPGEEGMELVRGGWPLGSTDWRRDGDTLVCISVAAGERMGTRAGVGMMCLGPHERQLRERRFAEEDRLEVERIKGPGDPRLATEAKERLAASQVAMSAEEYAAESAAKWAVLEEGARQAEASGMHLEWGPGAGEDRLAVFERTWAAWQVELEGGRGEPAAELGRQLCRQAVAIGPEALRDSGAFAEFLEGLPEPAPIEDRLVAALDRQLRAQDEAGRQRPEDPTLVIEARSLEMQAGGMLSEPEIQRHLAEKEPELHRMALMAVRCGICTQWDPPEETVSGWVDAFARTYVAWQRDLASGREEEATEKLYQLCRGVQKAGLDAVRENPLMQRFVAGVRGESEAIGQSMGMSMRA